MELKEARKKATKLKNADLDIPVYIAELINTIVTLDDRITELEEQFSIANQCAKDNASTIVQQQEVALKGGALLRSRAEKAEAQRDELLEICRVAEKTAIEIYSGRRHEGSMPCGLLADRLNRIIGEIDKKEIKQPSLAALTDNG